MFLVNLAVDNIQEDALGNKVSFLSQITTIKLQTIYLTILKSAAPANILQESV